jgi:hypothetical protein
MHGDFLVVKPEGKKPFGSDKALFKSQWEILTIPVSAL